MSSSPLINWILRGFQALFGIVTLGLAVTLIRGHHWGSLPSSIGFAAFAGGITILAAIIGFAATWVSMLEGIIGMAVDGIIALVNIAAGIVLVIKLGGVKCNADLSQENAEKIAYNDLFNGGCMGKGEDQACWVPSNYYPDAKKVVDILIGHCKESQATMVFCFLAAAVLVISALLAFLRKRKGY